MKRSVIIVFLATAYSVSAQDAENTIPPNAVQRATSREQGRSLVISKYGMVATSQTLASQAGAQVLEAGGNAIDAAIAANAVMGVVEPESDGLGGDLFAIYYEARTGKLYGLNSSGWAPSHLTVDALKAKGLKTMPQDGINSISVPGMVAGWEALRTRFGTMPYPKLLASAITYAQEGFPVTEWISEDWERNAKKLARDPFTWRKRCGLARRTSLTYDPTATTSFSAPITNFALGGSTGIDYSSAMAFIHPTAADGLTAPVNSFVFDALTGPKTGLMSQVTVREYSPDVSYVTGNVTFIFYCNGTNSCNGVGRGTKLVEQVLAPISAEQMEQAKQ